MNNSIGTEEEHRLAAVERYKKHYKKKATDLQDIVILAARICNASAALISVVEQEKILIKAATGFTNNALDHNNFLCGHAIRNDTITVISDFLIYDKIDTLPLVKEGFRSYAAVNLKSHDGYNVGTLCIYDTKVRDLSGEQLQSLVVLAKQVCHLVELEYRFSELHQKIEEIQRQKFEIETTKVVLKSILDSSNTHHLLVSRKFAILAFNKGVADFYEVVTDKRMKVGDSIFDYIPSYYADAFINTSNLAFAGEVINVDCFLTFGSLDPQWWGITISPTKTGNGEIIGVSYHAIDIHERKTYYEKMKKQNESLKEIAFVQAHEIRGPLASILGLINLMKSEEGPRSEYVHLLEVSAKQLDSRISKIINLTHDTE
ncbi:GAF domain-containing protein [Desertivirga xinjiangensis]|uniref:GAF domain-containing protein n=1 Tax=Desertivirga xinjiangensis TaxID=539206 RepID=UPI00210B6229|nr:GAF domain-containing protein [Pedobacter xinjiangensis]